MFSQRNIFSVSVRWGCALFAPRQWSYSSINRIFTAPDLTSAYDSLRLTYSTNLNQQLFFFLCSPKPLYVGPLWQVSVQHRQLGIERHRSRLGGIWSLPLYTEMQIFRECVSRWQRGRGGRTSPYIYCLSICLSPLLIRWEKACS